MTIPQSTIKKGKIRDREIYIALEGQPQMPASDLKGLGEAKFVMLSAAERLVLERVPSGDPAICGPSHDAADNDLRDADVWGAARQIRAELVAWLCIDLNARALVHQRGIHLYGADITGPLDLSSVNIPFPLTLRHCRVKEEINLSRAVVPDLDLQGSWADRISAAGTVVKNDIYLSDGFRAAGGVVLTGAHIGGDLDCAMGALMSRVDHEPYVVTALDGDRMTVRGSVLLMHGFRAEGCVSFIDAQIGGDLYCANGTFTNPPERDPFGGGGALNAYRMKVKGSVFLTDGFAAKGIVSLVEAQIGGRLICRDGEFENPSVVVHAGNGLALNANRIEVRTDVFLTEGFRAQGEVSLVDAQIGGKLDCSGGTFSNPRGVALNGGGATVNSVLLTNRFTANGRVNLDTALIGGRFDCRNGNFQEATLDLTDASASSLYDSGLNDTRAGSATDSEATVWPQPGNLFLDGFVYGRISSRGRINIAKRIEWLELQPSTPFPSRSYLQLAKVFRESADSDRALSVRERMEELRRRSEEGGPFARFWSFVLKASIGYGYRPGRAIWLIILLSLLGWIVYGISYHSGKMVPTDKDAYLEFLAERQVPSHYPTFSPLVYSLENSLPLVKLGQADKWQPYPGPESWSPTSPRLVLWFLWIQILLGWLLATLFVAGVTGIVQKE